MAFKLEFKTDNAAFCDDNGEEHFDYEKREIGRILMELGKSFELFQQSGKRSGTVPDINGNTVGEWSLTDD